MAVLSAPVLATVCTMFLATTYGHLCLLSPPQRGPLGDLNTKGAKSCFQVQGPCGKIPGPSEPSQEILLTAKSTNITVVFQKNLDHFNSASPGYFSVALGEKLTASSDEVVPFKELARVSDSASAPSLFLYDLTIQLPLKNSPWYILQVSYVTKNPNAPPAFYQCADFAVIIK